MTSETFLVDFFKGYSQLHRNCGDGQARNFRSVIAAFSDYLRRHAVVADLTTETINGFLLWHEKLGRAKGSLQKLLRGNLAALWKDAHAAKLLAAEPSGLRRYRTGYRMPKAWTIEELQKLIDGCDDPRLQVTLRKSAILQGDYLRGLIHFVYDTGLRVGDVIQFRYESMREDGVFAVVQNKTDEEISRRVRPSTMKALAAIYTEGHTDPLFGWATNESHCYLCYVWRKLLKVVGFEVKGNGLQKLRRTSATHLESVRPGSATTHLGHKTPTMARAHYLDPRIITPLSPLPPDILPPSVDAKGGIHDA